MYVSDPTANQELTEPRLLSITFCYRAGWVSSKPPSFAFGGDEEGNDSHEEGGCKLLWRGRKDWGAPQPEREVHLALRADRTEVRQNSCLASDRGLPSCLFCLLTVPQGL